MHVVPRAGVAIHDELKGDRVLRCSLETAFAFVPAQHIVIVGGSGRQSGERDLLGSQHGSSFVGLAGLRSQSRGGGLNHPRDGRGSLGHVDHVGAADQLVFRLGGGQKSEQDRDVFGHS